MQSTLESVDSQTKKNFEDLHDAYRFFQGHATEMQACSKTLASLIHIPSDEVKWKMMDFGCGDGVFTQALLNQLSSRQRPKAVVLADIDKNYSRQAQTRITQYFPNLDANVCVDLSAQSSDYRLIISNHVFYYVADIEKLLQRLFGLLEPGGQLLVTMARPENAILQCWQQVFSLMGQKVPYGSSEDFIKHGNDLGLDIKAHEVISHLCFEDSVKNRCLTLAFMFGNHLDNFTKKTFPLHIFDIYSNGHEVKMTLKDVIFEVTRHEG